MPKSGELIDRTINPMTGEKLPDIQLRGGRTLNSIGIEVLGGLQSVWDTLQMPWTLSIDLTRLTRATG